MAAFQKRDGVDALPSVMSFNAPRLSASRPNVERLRERATGAPATVAVANTGPCTVSSYSRKVFPTFPALKWSMAVHWPLKT